MGLKKTSRWALFKIENDKTITNCSSGDKDQTVNDFRAALPEAEPRFGLVDVDYTADDGRPHNLLWFIFWSPEAKCTVKDKMLYASSKDALKKKFTGLMKEIQANSMDDISDANIQQLMKSLTRLHDSD